MGWNVMWRAKAHMPKRARPSIITNQVIKSTSSTAKNYSVAWHYYHQPGDQKYVQYSKFIRHPTAIITNQLRKLHLQSSNFKSFIYKSPSFKASPTKLQCRVYKYLLRITVTSAHTWIEFEVSSQQPLLTEDLGNYIMDSFTIIREHHRQLSNRLATSINSSPSLMY
ncbi:hypothetical protein PS2_045904 [Malus domestica]